jgi:hypothetical protein
MNHSRCLANSFVFGVLLLLTWPQSAHAYLDPGTGSYVLQLIIAGLVGGALGVKIYWKRIKAFLFRSSSREQDGEDAGS